ncbi:MAG: molybdate ABC transporter permease subunit [Leptolyngbyaceae cyanobacterium SL_7_1]|nr:molybdate ABC transporter permease subunit [Leptolyngbyaceae cyanobacterium SL_7_1]
MPADLSPLWISLKTAGLATIASFFIGTAAAYGMLGYRGRWKSVIEGLLIAPLILPPTVVGFLLLLLFGKNGLLGKAMQPFDLTIIFTWYAAVVAAVVVSFPLMYKTALGAFEQIDPDLLQVARTLGAAEPRVVRQILLPLAIPGLLAGTTLAFARALGEFGATLMLAGNIPGQTQTMPMAIFFAVEAGAMGEAWGWAIAIMVLSLSGLMVVNHWQKRYELKLHGNQTGWVEADEPVHRGGNPTIAGDRADRSYPQRAGQPELVVEIENQHPGFTLNTAFVAQETLGILGGSGSGKSMTLRCIAGIETPTRGRIALNGRSLFDSEQRINLPMRQRHVGLVLQHYALFPHLTVTQNIAFGVQHLPKPLRVERVHQHLHRMQLQGLGDRYPHQLSGGQQQRVALARALATSPEVLLLDEPFSALDTYLRSQLERQLLEILSTYGGVTLFVTHNLEEAYRLCEKLLVMSGGKPIAHDTKHRIFEHPQTVRVAQLTGCKNFSQAVGMGDGAVRAIDWGVRLTVLESIPDRLTDVGIRAHQLRITTEPEGENSYPCWLASTSETPHRMTLFLKLNAVAADPQDYDVQAEIFKEKWNAIKDRPFPWYVRFDPIG